MSVWTDGLTTIEVITTVNIFGWPRGHVDTVNAQDSEIQKCLEMGLLLPTDPELRELVPELPERSNVGGGCGCKK